MKNLFFFLFLLVLSCSAPASQGTSAYTLETTGTAEQTQAAYNALLARLNKLNCKIINSRISDKNHIILELPAHETERINRQLLREYLQKPGQLTLSETYPGVSFIANFMSDYDTNDTLKTFLQRLFSIMQPYQPQDVYGTGPYPLLGFANKKDTALLGKMLNDSLKQFGFMPPVRTMFSPSLTDAGLVDVVAISTVWKASIHPQITGAEAENSGGRSERIEFQLNPAYTSLWEEMTERNVGKSIAIIIDGQLQAYPTVIGTITSGQVSFDLPVGVSGQFFTVIISSPYPCEVKIVEEKHSSGG
ncbi:MAG: hypothetical protein MUC87_19045 [Bacteroidia bacterium]|jgi:preprotein translocase subunit SecD|nr:hypothetical protein [Bacteroidia bacterium]